MVTKSKEGACSLFYCVSVINNNTTHKKQMEEQWVIDLRNFVCDEPDPNEIIEERNPFAGRTHTEETKKQMSASAKNRPPVSEETRRKNAKFGEANGFYGKTHSEKTRKKMSLVAKGNKNALGYKMTQEQIEKSRQKRIGRKQSEVEKEKRRIAISGRKWYNNGTITKMLRECPPGWNEGRNLNTKEEKKD